jgi:biotin carboxyl carrier protein
MISGISIKIPSKRDEISHKIRQYDSASNSVLNLQLKFIKAPMPGLVKSVLVTQGQTVSKDSPILILEAMKMENTIKAGYSGIIKEVITEVGKNVEKNEILLKIEA